MEDLVDSLTRGNVTEVKVLLASVALEHKEDLQEERLKQQEDLQKERLEQQEDLEKERGGG